MPVSRSVLHSTIGGASSGEKAPEFDDPIRLPADDKQRKTWQAANKAWWDAAPMRYDWREPLREEVGSQEYFTEIDRRFFAAARFFTSPKAIPFDAIIDFADLGTKRVLEIGVGHGTHAQLLAPRCKSFVGIDLTAAATRMTATRLKQFGAGGAVLQMDAECLAFADGSFDYVWSWGVIHQTADTRGALAEIRRVTQPGGRCTVMVYYRSWWNYYVCSFLRGLAAGRLLMPGSSIHALAQSASDGAIARYYTAKEWREVVGGLFEIESIEIRGLKSDAVPLPYGRLKQMVLAALPDPVARFLTRRLRMGSLMIVQMRRPEAG